MIILPFEHPVLLCDGVDPLNEPFLNDLIDLALDIIEFKPHRVLRRTRKIQDSTSKKGVQMCPPDHEFAQDHLL